MSSGEEIVIELYFANFEDNKNVLAQLTDATTGSNAELLYERG